MTLAFTSRLSKPQAVAVLLWLPVHLLLLPFLVYFLLIGGLVSEAMANLLIYAVGAAYMLLVLRRFFRQEFDVFCDHPLRVLLLVFGAYWVSRFAETAIALLLQELDLDSSNFNNESVIEMAKANLGPTAAMAVFLAPIVEESLFRAGIFGLLRHKNRVLAYIVGVLAFGLYHVLGPALDDPIQLLFILQYIPPTVALIWVYEKTNTVWSCIFLHMLVNGTAMLSIRML